VTRQATKRAATASAPRITAYAARSARKVRIALGSFAVSRPKFGCQIQLLTLLPRARVARAPRTTRAVRAVARVFPGARPSRPEPARRRATRVPTLAIAARRIRITAPLRGARIRQRAPALPIIPVVRASTVPSPTVRRRVARIPHLPGLAIRTDTLVRVTGATKRIVPRWVARIREDRAAAAQPSTPICARILAEARRSSQVARGSVVRSIRRRTRARERRYRAAQ